MPKLISSLLALFLATSQLGYLQAAPSQDDQVWRFQVYVNDKPVGFHEFRLQQNGEQQLISSVAEFKYKLLFVTLYDYQHHNQEVWQDGCLSSIHSSTDANGKDYSVAGNKDLDGFRVETIKNSAILTDCVMSFAYWNPQFLQAKSLLNAQDGEYLEVAVTEPVKDSLQVQGKEMAALRYQLTAKKIKLQLWYSEQGAWLGLKSIYKSDRTLRYELISPPITLKPITLKHELADL